MARSCTLKGNSFNLEGAELSVGDTAPGATLRENLLTDIELSTFTGKKRVISVVPSLDTGVCAEQTKRFNEEAAKLTDVSFITISVDLPPAQARFCGAESINAENMTTLSDHIQLAFGNAYGTLMPELRVNCRAVFVVDGNDKLTYVEYVPEVTEHPKYDAVLAAALKL
jgi:thiol peroxidase